MIGDYYAKLGELKALHILISKLWEQGIICDEAFREMIAIVLDEDVKIREEIEANKHD